MSGFIFVLNFVFCWNRSAVFTIVDKFDQKTYIKLYVNLTNLLPNCFIMFLVNILLAGHGFLSPLLISRLVWVLIQHYYCSGSPSKCEKMEKKNLWNHLWGLFLNNPSVLLTWLDSVMVFSVGVWPSGLNVSIFIMRSGFKFHHDWFIKDMTSWH